MRLRSPEPRTVTGRTTHAVQRAGSGVPGKKILKKLSSAARHQPSCFDSSVLTEGLGGLTWISGFFGGFGLLYVHVD